MAMSMYGEHLAPDDEFQRIADYHGVKREAVVSRAIRLVKLLYETGETCEKCIDDKAKRKASRQKKEQKEEQIALRQADGLCILDGEEVYKSDLCHDCYYGKFGHYRISGAVSQFVGDNIDQIVASGTSKSEIVRLALEDFVVNREGGKK